MNIIITILRMLMGALFIFASTAYFFNLVETPELTGNAKLFMDGMMASQYFFPLLKGVELLCGIAFLSGFYVPLAAVVIAPIIVNILLYHAFVIGGGLATPLFLVIVNALVAYKHWDQFRPMLRAR